MTVPCADHETTAGVVDRIAEALVLSRNDALQRLFRSAGAREPMVVWSPGKPDLLPASLARFAVICRTLCAHDDLPRKARFDLEAFGALRDWMMLVAPEGGGYRYLHYGSGIADQYGRDMTGCTTADIGGHIQTFFEAVYRAAERRREWVLTEHEPPRSVFVCAWRRLIVPVIDDNGRSVAFFAAINLPENELRAGLDFVGDPVFVLDGERVVHYANVAARRAFALRGTMAPGPTLGQLTGLDLGRLPPLEEIFTDTRIADRVELTLHAGVAERRRITVSAAEHRDRLFYVVVINRLEV